MSLKAKLVARLLAHSDRAAFIVDEAVTVTEDGVGARTLGDPGGITPPGAVKRSRVPLCDVERSPD